jgi:hypothetical protein
MTELTEQDIRRNYYWLLGLFLFSVLNGAIRKWIFVGNSGVNNLLLFGQMLAPFIIVAFMRREKNWFSYFPLVPYAIALVAFALNPMNMSLFHGLFGFFLHFGFWLLMLTYIHEREAFPLEKMIKPMLIVCLVEGILSFIQFQLPIEHPLNRYESGDAISGFEGGGVRVTGTFSYISSYSAFLFFFGFFIWALMVEQKRPIVLIYVLAVLAVLAAFMNGSRSTVLPVVVFILFGLLSYGNVLSKIRALLVIPVLLVLAMLFGLGNRFPAIGKAYDAFMTRVEYGQRTGESSNRALESFIEVTTFDSRNPLFGLGLGATYQGANQVWGKSHYVAQYGYFEEEPERVMLEGGYALLIIRALLFLLLIKQLKIPLLLSVPVMVYIFFLTQMISSTYQALFTFFGLAILDKMYYINEDNR